MNLRVLSHLVLLPGLNQSFIASSFPCWIVFTLYPVIWVQTVIHLHHQSNSSLPLFHCNADAGEGSKMHSIAHLTFIFCF